MFKIAALFVLTIGFSAVRAEDAPKPPAQPAKTETAPFKVGDKVEFEMEGMASGNAHMTTQGTIAKIDGGKYTIKTGYEINGKSEFKVSDASKLKLLKE